MATEQHRKFLKRLDASASAVFAVAEWLHASGKTVEVPSVAFAPTAADAETFVNDGDLFVVERKKVEVKRLGVSFTCREDWPFRDAFV